MLTPGQDPAAGESPNTFRVFLTIVHAWNGWKNMCSPMCGGLGTRFVNFRRLRCLAEKSVRGEPERRGDGPAHAASTSR